MCGIVAIYSHRRRVNAELLGNAVEQLRPRGPDDTGIWIDTDRGVGLGHARLSIIDAATGTQPMANEDDTLRLIVNGEFYDFERIREDLKKLGHHFSTLSDSEIALHLYEQYGTGCLEYLRGEFAFAIWDVATGELFAARDRFGIKPLFYAVDADNIYLASEVKALFAAGVRPSWDHESVFQHLYFSVDQDRSLFRGVRQVPPGHFLRIKDGVVSVKSYWDVDYPRASAEDFAISSDDCVDGVRELLTEAVRLRMRADVPVGCYLSGGVDSSSVLGLAATFSNSPLTAFTIAFDHDDFNETESARLTAAFAGADYHPVPVKAADFAEDFEEAVWRGEMIHYNAHGAARFRLSRNVRDAGYKVVLAGEGADELFAGYDFSSQAVLSAGSSDGIAKWARIALRMLRPKNRIQRDIARTSPWLARLSQGLAFPPHLLEYVGGKFDLLAGIIAPDIARRFDGRDPYREFFRQFDYRSTLYGREPAKQILYLWMKSVFVNYVLAAERLDMAHAVEVRLPFLDHKLFEFARSIPVQMLAENGRLKHLLREAVKPYVRPEVYDGLKQPFIAPPTDLVQGNAMFDLLQDVLRSESFAAVPFFDQRAVIRLLDELPAMDAGRRASMDPVLFMMASYGILQAKYRL